MATFFTSDTHFGHERIISLCERPFDSVDEMNEEMIRRWNETVKPTDTVIHLGDVALGKIAESLPLVGRLNGHIKLVPGNHDRIFSGEKQAKRDRFMPEYLKVFDEVLPESLQMDVGGFRVVLSHFPYVGDSHGADRHADKRPKDEGLPIIHGHVHDEWAENGRMFNAGVDVRDFRPVHEDVVVDWLKSL
ncbi:metallophosphoesterase [Streptomyces phage Phredrick]|nr:metallophosphoesterase [Streptomyces phage Phredrick]